MLVKIKKPIKGYRVLWRGDGKPPREDAARLVNEGFAILIQDTEGEDENVLRRVYRRERYWPVTVSRAWNKFCQQEKR